MRKLFLLVTFFLAVPIFIVFSVIFLLSLSYQSGAVNPPLFTHQNSVAYAALPTSQGFLLSEIGSQDARVEMIRQFFQRYNSPLEPYASQVVLLADKYGIDFRLIPAIAMQESNLCKKEPPGSYNCWGFGVYGGKVKKFVSYAKAIEIITKTLAKEYKGKGLETPSEIMSKYTPSNDGAWAYSVTHFMNQLQ